MARNVPLRFVFITVSKSNDFVSRNDLKVVAPALFIRQSILPYLSLILFAVPMMLRSESILHTNAVASLPAYFISLFTLIFMFGLSSTYTIYAQNASPTILGTKALNNKGIVATGVNNLDVQYQGNGVKVTPDSQGIPNFNLLTASESCIKNSSAKLR